MKTQFDVKAIIDDIEKQVRQEAGETSVGDIAYKMIEKVEALGRDVPSMRVRMREALEERAFDARVDFDRGAKHKDALSMELAGALIKPKHYKPQLTAQDNEVLRVIEIAEKNNGGKETDINEPVVGKAYSGRVIGKTENYVVQELQGTPEKVVIHKQCQLAVGERHAEVGNSLDISYPYGRVGIVQESRAYEAFQTVLNVQLN